MKLPIKAMTRGSMLAAVLSTVGMQAAQAEGNNYFSVFGGLSSLDDTSISSPGGSISSDSDEGFGVGLAAGRWFDARKHWRGEIEISYRENDLDEVAGRGGGNAELNSLAYMVNGYYDFRPRARFSPYVGAGIGFADVEAENIAYGGTLLDDDDTVFAYQFIGGVGYEVSERVDLFGEVRYLATDDPSFNNRQLDYETVNLLGGVRYRF